MRNLDIFDYKDTVLPFNTSELNENNRLKPIPLENGDLFLYDANHLYRYENCTIRTYYDTRFKIDQIFSDELLNGFYIISKNHIRSISYEDDINCHDTDLFDLYDYNGEADDEIINAALSPDKEHIILVTKSSLVITLLSNFKLISADNLLSSSAKDEKESVNVGWGKVETQFQGSSKSCGQTVSSSNHVDDGPTSVVWCADSQLFAVNFFSPELASRQIKVYKVYGAGCTLQYTSKPIPGLEGHLSWRPHVMSHLASTQRLPNKYVLVFIEKNTELKDSFELRNVASVRGLKWNQDGTILAVMTDNNRVLMYTSSNWHWYLKQELNFSDPVPGKPLPVQLVWTSPNHCSILHNTLLRSYTWKCLVNAASGVVAVIDANEVLVTDFNKSVVPPPMCLQRVQLPESSENINRVLPLPNKPDDLLIITCSGSLHTFKSGVWDKLLPLSEGGISHERDMTWDGIYHKTCVWNEAQLVFVRGKLDLCAMNMQSGSPIEIIFTSQTPIVSVDVKSSSELILQLYNRDIIVYSRQGTNSREETPKSSEANTRIVETSPNRPESTPQVAFTLPELCTHIGSASGHLLALSSSHTLFDNGEQVLCDVSSFVLHQDWLLLTTLTHRLVLFRLVPGKQVEESDGISRRLERGGRLVAVTAACAAVLQMPRGNLEVVTPRPLILHLLSEMLRQKQYGEAYVQMRKHRIDLNLLVDYAPPDYNLLVEQVDNPSWLSNLIADLKPEDVTRQDAYYSEYYIKCAKTRTPAECASKDIATICAHLRSALQCRDPVKYMHTIMHCAVKAGVWNEALDIARQSSAALDFLILLHDVNSLYEVALRAYDLDLALQIAGKSQKDPKEYVPYLNRLRGLASHRMKAEIDRQFGAYLSAVRHLSCTEATTADTEQCFELIRKYKLWSQTLDVFPKGSESYETVLKEYGLQLELKGRSEEAGMMYERAVAYEEALRCFVKAGAWRSALISARTLNYGPDQLDSLYADLSRSLTSKSDVTGLVSMLEHSNRDGRITSDVILSVMPENQCLGVELARQYQESLIDSDIKPMLTGLHGDLTEDINSLERSLEAQLSRLLLVRSLPKPVHGGVSGAGDEEMSDWGSDTGSTLSTRSGHTGSSSSSRGRRKRKQDRKLWKLKEGNPREEISLVKSLGETITALEKCTGRVKQLCLALVRLEMDPLAQSLQSKLKLSLGAVDKKRDVIWPPPEEHETSVDDGRVNLPPVSSVLHHWELECLKRV